MHMERSFPSIRLVALGAALLLIGVALFQAGLALGAPWGSAAYGGGAAGADGVLPAGYRISSAIATVVLTSAALIILIRGGVMSVGVRSYRLARWAAWGIVGFLALNTLGNLASSSTVERWVLGGITLLLVILCAVVALRGSELGSRGVVVRPPLTS
jgi:hypothetical protein